MGSKQLIDAQFDRAVEMVQSLPKMGAIQTGYEEKLAMYSLYKQATVGNVKSPRPGMWDMLGRAKWDAWAKHKDLDPHEAKWLYIDELLRVLRKHEDKPAAQEMVEELESFGGDAGRMVMSGTSTGRSRWSQSQSSGSSTSSTPAVPGAIPQPSTSTRREQAADTTTSEEEDSDDDEEANERVGNLSGIPHPSQSQLSRPMSSMSNQRYRTPMGGSLAMSPPPPHPHMGMHSSAMSGSSAYAQQPLIPASQPMPIYETPSAFTGPSPPAPQADPNRVYGLPYPANMYAGHPSYRVVQPIPSQTPSAGKQHIGSPALPHGALSPIERAVAGVQAHLAALQERLETLETNTLGAINPSSTPYHSHSSLLSRRSSGSPAGRLPPPPPSWIWDWDPSDFNWEHMGMWSLVLSPLARTTGFLVKVLAFLLHRDRESRMSPALVVLRRLLLDLSFVLCAMMMVNKLWRKTGIRRREVLKALKGLWRAVIGNSVGVVEKVLVERGV